MIDGEDKNRNIWSTCNDGAAYGESIAAYKYSSLCNFIGSDVGKK